ncbi:formate dehydrogenase accessory sulfurtransferase FdhD [Panacagrimonas sp.]|uniref:formate dehydrogenase accessory sulfurtransferase FdhD n=1 Tax=Panacagrimonas sp. TaxID=2480088 RepID=UPI003B518E91
MTLPAHRGIQVWREDGAAPDRVAEEVPVALRYNGEPHVVMMCTPSDLEDFARGFSVTEGIVEDVAQIGAIQLRELSEDQGFEMDVAIPQSCAQRLAGRQRQLRGRTGCGLCGAQTLADVLRPARRVPAGVAVAAGAVRRALEALRRQQPLNAATGSTHAAAWATPDGLIVAVREDVGRHNALDKLIGHLLATNSDLARGFVVVTSRASYEMVAKSVAVGMPMLVAISAPTAYAVRLAEDAGLTLIGFARAHRHVVYACPGRVSSAPLGTPG